MEHVEVLRHMKETIKAIMPSEVAALDAAIASLSAPQPPAEAHCATCSCVPGMTPAVRFDTTPAEKEGAVRDHLIRMGWTPPAEAQPVGSVRRDRSAAQARAERLAEALRLIESAKDRGFGIDYARGVAQSALRDHDQEGKDG